MKTRQFKTLSFTGGAVASIMVALVLAAFSHTVDKDEKAKTAAMKAQRPINHTIPQTAKHLKIVFDAKRHSKPYIGLDIRLAADALDSSIMVEQVADQKDFRGYDYLDLSSLAWSSDAETITLALGKLIGSEAYLHETLRLTLPPRNWVIDLPDDLGDDHKLRNTAQALDVVLRGSDMTIAGRYGTLSVVQLYNCHGSCTQFDTAQIDTLHVYAERLRGVKVDLDNRLKAGEIHLHSTQRGDIELDDLSHIDKLHWNPQTTADAAVFKSFTR